MSRSASIRRRALAGAVALTLSVSPLSRVTSAATTATWVSPTSGFWVDSVNWSIHPLWPRNNVPPGATYDVLIDATGAPYTVTESNAIIVNSLTLAAPDATLQTNHDVIVPNGITVSAGTLIVSKTSLSFMQKLSSTIGGTGGNVYLGRALLDGVTLARDVIVGTPTGGGTIGIQNGLLMSNATLTLTGSTSAGSSVQFENTQSLSGSGEIVFAALGTTINTVEAVSGTTTIGSGINMHTSATRAQVTLTANGGIINQGRIAADGGEVSIVGNSSLGTPKTFVNQGLLEATNGGTLTITAPLSNDGVIRISGGGKVVLGGNFTGAPMLTVPKIGTLECAAGTLELVGDLDNNQTTIALNDVTGDMHLRSGRIFGGTVATSNGAMLRTTLGGGTLDAVTLKGHAQIIATSSLLVRNGVTLDGGRISLQGGAFCYLTASGAQTFGGIGEIVFDGANNNNRINLSQGALALGTGITLRTGTGGGTIGDAALGLTNDGIISAGTAGRSITVTGSVVSNSGTIEAIDGGALAVSNLQNIGNMKAFSGGTLSVSGAWNNAGTVRVNNGTVSLGGSFTPSNIGAVQRSGGTLRIAGTLNNSSTFNLDDYGGTWEIAGGSIVGGTVSTAADSRLIAAGATTLDGVTLSADLDVKNAVVTALNNLTLNGRTVSIQRTSGTVGLTVAGTLGGTGEIVFDSGSGMLVQPATTVPMTIQPGITIRSGEGFGTVGRSTMPTINHGVIIATNGRSISLTGNSFTNHGLLKADPNSVISLNGTWSNAGVIEVNGGTLGLGGTFTIDSVGTINRSGGIIQVSGTLNNTGKTLLLNSTTGPWFFAGGTINGGTVRTEDGIVIASFGMRLAGVTVDAALAPNASYPITLDSGITLTDAGVITLNGGKVIATVPLTIGGSGQIVFVGNPSTNGVTTETFISGPLTLGPQLTVRTGTEGGTIGGASGNIRVVNQGMISSQTAGKTISILGTFTNSGSVEARNGGIMTTPSFPVPTNYSGGTLTGGKWHVYSGSTINLTGLSITTNAAEVSLSGPLSTLPAINALTSNNGTFSILAGRDFTTASSLMNAGRLVAGVGSDLKVSGNLTQNSAAVLAVELSSDLTDETYGQFAVTGSATLAGTLDVLLAPEFDLHVGDLFTLLTAAQVSGTFDQVILPSNLAADVLYSPTAVQLQVTAVPEPTMLALAALGALALIRRRRGR